MPSLDESYPEMVDALVDRYGRPDPFPDEPDPFARIVLAVLMRAMDAKKARLVVAGLRDYGLLEPASLPDAQPEEIAESIRPARVSLSKPVLRVLKRLGNWIAQQYECRAEKLEAISTAKLREELLALRAVGPATADAILLLALRRAEYPVDRASYRILVRHGWIDPGAEYDEARERLERQAPGEPETLAHLSTWFERIGVDYCRPKVAKCDRCPLRPFLPEGGPREPE